MQAAEEEPGGKEDFEIRAVNSKGLPNRIMGSYSTGQGQSSAAIIVFVLAKCETLRRSGVMGAVDGKCRRPRV